jgi:hypothetical protein
MKLRTGLPPGAAGGTRQLGGELGEAATRMLERARAAAVVRPEVTADDLRRLMCGVQHAVNSGDDDGTTAGRYLDILVRGLKP